MPFYLTTISMCTFHFYQSNVFGFKIQKLNSEQTEKARGSATLETHEEQTHDRESWCRRPDNWKKNSRVKKTKTESVEQKHDTWGGTLST